MTFHTIGNLIRWVKYEGRVALATGFETTRLASDGNVSRPIVFFATNNTFGFWEGWSGDGDGSDGGDGSDDSIGGHS